VIDSASPEVRPAGRLAHRARKRNHEIQKGEPRFVVRQPRTPLDIAKAYSDDD
jgi:hypothetical protein